MSLPGRKIRQCCIPNCKSIYYKNVCNPYYRNKSFFRITTDRQILWIESVRKLCEPDFTLTNGVHYFCEDHFELKCFKNSKRNSLNRSAVPTLFSKSTTSSPINCNNVTSDSIQYSAKQFVNVTIQNFQSMSCPTSILDDFTLPPVKKPKYTYSKLPFPISATANTSAITDSKLNGAESNTGYNVSATSYPATCRPCLNSLGTHGGFLKECLNAQENYESADNESVIKSEEIKIKLEDDQDGQEQYESVDMPVYIKFEEIEIKGEDDRDCVPSSYDLHAEIIESKKRHVSEDVGVIKEEYECETGFNEKYKMSVLVDNIQIPKNEKSRLQK